MRPPSPRPKCGISSPATCEWRRLVWPEACGHQRTWRRFSRYRTPHRDLPRQEPARYWLRRGCMPLALFFFGGLSHDRAAVWLMKLFPGQSSSILIDHVRISTITSAITTTTEGLLWHPLHPVLRRMETVVRCQDGEMVRCYQESPQNHANACPPFFGNYSTDRIDGAP